MFGAFFLFSLKPAKSVQIKSVITQYHDKLPAGGSDTNTLPRRFLNGSGDHLETQVAEEERVSLAEVLKKAEKSVPELLLHLEKAELKPVDDLSKMVTVGEHVGTSATSSRERIHILQKNYEDAVAQLDQVTKNHDKASRDLNALVRKEAEALYWINKINALSLRHSGRADDAANNAVRYLTNFYNYKSSMNKAAEDVNAVSIKPFLLRARLYLIHLLVHVDNSKEIRDRQASLQNAVVKATQEYRAAEYDEGKFRNFANYYQLLLNDADEKQQSEREMAEIYKNYASLASESYNSYEREIERAVIVFTTAQAKQDAQIRKVILSFQKLMAAQDEERPQLDSNFGAILSEKPTIATQDLIAAHAAQPAHFDTHSHVIPASEKLDLTLSLSDPPNLGKKRKRKNQSDHLDDNRKSGVKIINDIDAGPKGL
ncbi:hypothetical protein Plhal304r1_c002g0005461 [Plasmopara halstedii]